MITVKEAKELAQSNRTRLIGRQQDMIEESIREAASKGYYATKVYTYNLFPEVEAVLCSNGFKIVEPADAKDYIMIKWE